MYVTMYRCYVSLVVSLSAHKMDNMIYPKVYGSHQTLYNDQYTSFQKYKKYKFNNLSAGHDNYYVLEIILRCCPQTAKVYRILKKE